MLTYSGRHDSESSNPVGFDLFSGESINLLADLRTRTLRRKGNTAYFPHDISVGRLFLQAKDWIGVPDFPKRPACVFVEGR